MTRKGRQDAAYSLLFRKVMLITFIIVAIVILDQFSKYLAVQYLFGAGKTTFIPHFLSLQYHENRGAAWGMFSEQRWIFMTVSTLAIIGIIAFFIIARKQKLSSLLKISLSFFCAGGIGNMIDRVYLGHVIDFLKFEFIEFPIFNVADSFISIGACLMVLYLILDSVKEFKSKRKNTDV